MNTFRRFVTGLLMLLLCSVPPIALAWGPGHDDVMRAVLKGLPEPLRATFTAQIEQELIEKDSHFPDSFDPLRVEEMGASALERLTAAGITRRYDLHSDRGRAMAFAILVDALREKNPVHTARWIAVLAHGISDMVACNHDPLVHTATYGWSGWDLKLAGGGSFKTVKPLLDLGGSAADPAGGAEAFAKAIARMPLSDDQRDATKALVDVMLYGQEGARFCGPRGVPILEGAAAWVDRQDGAGRQKLWNNLAELGAWAVARTLRDVQVAMRLAKSEARIELTPQIEARYREGVEQLLRERRLEEDALFAPVLRELSPDQAPAVGVVLEPTWSMNEGMLGFNNRVQSVAIARSLRVAGRLYATFDLRRVLADGFPTPRKVPVTIIVAPEFRSYHGMKTADLDQAIAGYLELGGRIVWVGGTLAVPAKSLAALGGAMKKEAGQTLPVDDAEFVGSTLRFHLEGDPHWKIANSPRTPAGWQRALSPWRFELSGREGVRPLVTLESDRTRIVVGAITADARMAWLPIYALTPHLLDGSDVIAEPAEPSLDSAGKRILGLLLDAMR